jgi:monoamine oxidase
VVLEAQDRVGGRIKTLREPYFSHDLSAEAGAFFVSNQHRLLNHYISEYNLKLEPLLPDAPTLYYLHTSPDPWLSIDKFRAFVPPGTTTLARDLWPPQIRLTDREKAKGLFGFLGDYLPSVEGAESTEDWSKCLSPISADAKVYDKMPFTEFLRTRGASEGATKLLQPWFVPYMDDYENLSALGVLREAHAGRSLHKGREVKWSTIAGGMDALPRQIATHLPAGTIRLKSPVLAIRFDGKVLTVTYRELGTKALKEDTADHVICAIPFSTLRRVEVSPPFSPPKRKAIAELGCAHVARVYIQCMERVWIKDPWKGVVYTDLPIMNLIDSTFRVGAKPSTPGILHAYMSGMQANTIMAMSEPDRISFVVDQMDTVFPGLKKSFREAGERGASVCWDEDPWAQGAYTCFHPGQMTELLPHLATPEWTETGVARVHFAGDHTSCRPGWMEGALESGHRAAREIDSAIPMTI